MIIPISCGLNIFTHIILRDLKLVSAPGKLLYILQIQSAVNRLQYVPKWVPGMGNVLMLFGECTTRIQVHKYTYFLICKSVLNINFLS
jgi:hypothetical protein